MEEKVINCDIHGEQGYGIMCTHLVQSKLSQDVVGFHEQDSGERGRPDAWCNACEARWDFVKTEAQHDQWELDCDFKILCVACWDAAKALNV